MRKRQVIGALGLLVMGCGSAPTPAMPLSASALAAIAGTPESAVTAELDALNGLEWSQYDREVQARAARIVAAHPDGPIGANAALVHAQVSESLFDFEPALASYVAAASYFAAVRQTDERPKAAAALMRASALSTGLGRHLYAASLAERAIGLDPTLTPALLDVAESYAKSGSAAARGRVQALQRLVLAQGHPWASLRARVQLAQMRQGDARAAAFARVAALTAKTKDPQAITIHVQARFEMIEPAFRRFATHFNWPTDRVEQAARLKAFIAEGERLRRAYRALVQPDDVHVALGALWRVGRIFDVLDGRLRTIKPPTGLSAEMHTAWRAGIDALQARGFRAQAIETWRAVVTRARHLEVAGSWESSARASLCHWDRCPQPGPPPDIVKIPTAMPPFAGLEGIEHAHELEIFGLLIRGIKQARTAAAARFEAAPGDRFTRLNRLRAALQVAPGLAQVLDSWAWVRADPLALDLLAETAMALDDRAQAQALLHDAVRLPGAPAEAYARLAVLEAISGRLAGARALAQKALSRRPDFTEAQQVIDQLTPSVPL